MTIPLSSNTTTLFVAKVTLGDWFTGITVIMKVCGALAFVPPLAVPPLSWAITVTVATPKALTAGVKLSVPWASIAGWTPKMALLSFVTRKLTT